MISFIIFIPHVLSYSFGYGFTMVLPLVHHSLSPEYGFGTEGSLLREPPGPHTSHSTRRKPLEPDRLRLNQFWGIRAV